MIYFGDPEWVSLPPSTAGFVLQTNGPGNAPTWVDPGSAALPVATQVGQVLYSVDGSTFTVELPVTSRHGWLVNNDGIHIVVG
jgi:hypothetical protein